MDKMDNEKWDTKYMNDLPDSAFVLIEKGGKKDDEGKTVPKSLRHLPIRDDKGNIDLPHLRNALARLSQVKAKDGKKLSKSLQDKLRKKLEIILMEQKEMEFERELEEFGVARLFGHPAGQLYQIKNIMKYMTPHKKFVEPFAGSATIYFAKDPEDKAVLNDIGIFSKVLRYIKNLTGAEIQALCKKSWTSSKPFYIKLRDSKPSNKVDFLHKFCYTSRFSYGGKRREYKSSSAGESCTLNRPERWKRVHDRLQNTDITSVDYKECIRRNDGPDTFFYIDPPYYPENDKRIGGFKIGEITPDDFVKALKLIKKGNFIATIGNDKEWIDKMRTAGFNVTKTKSMQGTPKQNAGVKKCVLIVPFVSNFGLSESTRVNKSSKKKSEMEFHRTDIFMNMDAHNIQYFKKIAGSPNFVEMVGILFHRGDHKGLYYTDENLKSAKLKPRQGENLVYANWHHKKMENQRTGIMADIWWDDNQRWYCPVNKMDGKGALMYRTVITEPTTVKEVLNGNAWNVSAELGFDTYFDKIDGKNKEVATHIAVQGQAITNSPALPVADIDTVCTVSPDGERKCEKLRQEGKVK